MRFAILISSSLQIVIHHFCGYKFIFFFVGAIRTYIINLFKSNRFVLYQYASDSFSFFNLVNLVAYWAISFFKFQ